MSKALQEAGAAIVNSKLTDDVRRVSSEKDLTNRNVRRAADAEDRDSGADERRVPTRGERSKRRRGDEQEDRQPKRKARVDEDYEDDQEQRRPASRDDHSREEDEDDDSGDQDDRREYSDEEDDADDDSNREDGEDGEDQDREDGEYDDESDEDEKRHTVKVAGKEIKVSLSDLKRGYMMQGDYQRKTQAIAARDKELTSFHGQAAKDYQDRVGNLGFVVNKLREMLAGDANSVQMQELYARNPQQWAVERQRMQDRIGKLDTVLEQLGNEYKRHQTATANQNQDMLVRAAQTEREMMYQHIPDWDEGANGRPAVKTLVGKFLREFGFSDQELAPIIDHRMLRIADMARRYLELKKRTDQPQRRAKPVPRRVRPQGGGQQTRQDTRQRQQQGNRRQSERLRNDLRKTGDMRTAGKLIEGML